MTTCLVGKSADGLVTSEGTIYPLLSRLRRDGLVTTTWHESPSGPPRRYYQLTPAGQEALELFTTEWDRFTDAVDHRGCASTTSGTRRWPLWIAAGANPKEVPARAGHAQPAPASPVVRLPRRAGRGPSVASEGFGNGESAAARMLRRRSDLLGCLVGATGFEPVTPSVSANPGNR
jgi:Transcriptional regulator PadR-like family